MLEDMGFFCVDNMPIPLLEKFVELIALPNKEISKVALGLDEIGRASCRERV